MNIKCIGLLLAAMQISAGLTASTTTEVLSDADRLVAEKKYLSAFQLLAEQEDGDADPDIALKKADIALNYFANSIMHKVFAFRDLEEWENIREVRGSAGKFQMFNFDMEKVLSPLIEKYPEDMRLPIALADFYIDVYEKYRGQWEKSDTDLLESAHSQYNAAMALGDLDEQTYFRIGKTDLYLEHLPDAARMFEISVQKADDYAPARYNLAYAYLFMNRPAEAAPQAIAAYELYEPIPLKADAAMLAGQAYRELGKNDDALKYFVLCDRIAPEKYENLKRLMEAYVATNRVEDAKNIGERVFSLDPTNPTSSQAILENFIGSSHKGELPGIFTGLAEKYSDNPEAAGNALFHLALFYNYSGMEKPAMETLDEAESCFRKCLDEDHPVFKAIDNLRKQGESPARP